MKKIHLIAAVIVTMLFLTLVTYTSQGSPPAPAAAAPQAGSTMFIENAGQFAEGARFQMRGADRTIWLADDAIWITLLGQTEPQPAADPLGLPGSPAEVSTPDLGVNLRLSFVGANPRPVLEPFAPLDTTISYFIGDDPDKWAAAVPVWGGVRYVDLYPGLDLELADGGAMRLVCRAAGCQPALAQVRLQVDGADSLALNDGGLVIDTAAGGFSLPWLEVVDQDGRPLATGSARPSLANTVASAPLAGLPPDRTAHPLLQNLAYLPLILQPRYLLYSTYLGGSDGDSGKSIAIDSASQAYVAGDTFSTDFPTTPGAFDPTTDGSGDIFVVKLNSEGSGLLYGTFIGGSDMDYAEGIAVDGTGQAHITGWTWSTDFPTTPGAFDTTYNNTSGQWDAFVAKLNPSGSGLIYGTFLGGSSANRGNEITLNVGGQAYVTGTTASGDFPTTPGAFDKTYNGNSDGFVANLNTAGSELLYSTFLGGEESDGGLGIAVNGSGQAHVVGSTSSALFPTTLGAFDPSFNGGDGDAFVVKLNMTGTNLLYGTFLGGSNLDGAYGVALDAFDQAYVSGHTLSADFPTTPGVFGPTKNEAWDLFVVKLNDAGSQLLYSTFLGGSDSESHDNAIGVDGLGQAYVTGRTQSNDFPTTPGAFDRHLSGYNDAFLAILNPAATRLVYSTYFGGLDHEAAGGIAVTGGGRAFITGGTSSNDFPTTPGAFDTTGNETSNLGEAFVISH